MEYRTTSTGTAASRLPWAGSSASRRLGAGAPASREASEDDLHHVRLRFGRLASLARREVNERTPRNTRPYAAPSGAYGRVRVPAQPGSLRGILALSKLVVPGDAAQTVANIGAHHAAFIGMIFCYIVNFLEDVVIAWALYFLLAPVSRALSALAAIFRLVYTCIALGGVFNLVTAYRIASTPQYAAAFGDKMLQAQVDLLLRSFRYDYAFGIGVLFAIHLIIVGALIVRSRLHAVVARRLARRRRSRLDRNERLSVFLFECKLRRHRHHRVRRARLHVMVADKRVDAS